MPCIKMIGFRGFIYKMEECADFSFSVCNQAKLCFKLSYKNIPCKTCVFPPKYVYLLNQLNLINMNRISLSVMQFLFSLLKEPFFVETYTLTGDSACLTHRYGKRGSGPDEFRQENTKV